MSSKDPCPHCHQPELRRAPVWGGVVVALAWLFVVVMLFASALIGPFIVVAVPIIFAFGASAVRSAHDLAFAPPVCDSCGKVALGELPAPARIRVVAPALAQTA